MDTTSTGTTPLVTSTADLTTGTDAPSSPKRPRLDLPSADLNSTTNTLNGAVRRPKTASISTKDADKQPEELRGPEEQFVDQQLEVQDGADYYETLLTIQTAMNRLHHPTRHQIRMLLSLSLFPLLFKPPTKSSNHSFSRRGAPIAGSPSSDKPIASTLLPQTGEPLSKSHRKLREQARGLLRDVMVASGGAEVVCRAVRGGGRIETEREREERREREEKEVVKRRAEEQRLKAKKEDEEEEGSVMAKGKKVVRVAGSSRKNGPSSSSRRATSRPGTDDDEDLTPLESDDVLAVSATRIGQVEDLWEFLAGTTARKVRVRTRERPIIIDDDGGGGGWELVKVLVEGWEEEHKRKEKERVENDPPAPLSLLRYFKPSASSGFAREVSNKALDVVFWPFSEAAQPKKEEDDESVDEDEEMSEKGEKQGEKDGADKAEGEMGLQEKRAVATKLLGLIGYSAIDGYLSGAALLSEVVQRMKTLQPADFAAFIETLSVAPLPPAFLPRLLTSYLETHSHPLSSIADILPTPPPSSTLAASSTTSSGPTSPRKRGLGSTTSLSSVDLGGSSSAPNGSQQQQKQRPEATFWHTPSPTSSADFLPLLARIPIEVPLDPPTTSLPNSASSTKRPKLLLPKTFARAQAAVEAFGVVKTALVSVVAAEGEVGEEKREEWMDVMERVKEKVEEARRRVEQQGQGMGR